MIRPERLVMSSVQKEPVDGQNTLRGQIIDTSFIGGMTRVQVRMADGMVVTSKTISELGRAGVQPGTEVFLEWAPRNSVVLTN